MGMVIGIDQSARHTGVCVLSETGRVIALDLIEPSMQDVGARLAYIRDGIKVYFGGSAVSGTDVRAVVMEGYSYNSVSKKFVLGEVGGQIKLAVFDAKVPLYEAAPKQLKKFVTGSGTATKDQVMVAIKERWKIDIINDNLADAYGLAQIAHEITWPKATTRSQIEVVRVMAAKGLLKAARRPRVQSIRGTL